MRSVLVAAVLLAGAAQVLLRLQQAVLVAPLDDADGPGRVEADVVRRVEVVQVLQGGDVAEVETVQNQAFGFHRG